MVDVAFARRFRAPVTLDMLRADAALEGLLALQRGNRLSITPVERKHFDRILKLEPKS
jgi:predicted RNA-binding protein with PUA-like domain